MCVGGPQPRAEHTGRRRGNSGLFARFLGTCSVAFVGTNLLTMNTINSRSMPRRYGIVYADFPGVGLVSAVIAANF